MNSVSIINNKNSNIDEINELKNLAINTLKYLKIEKAIMAIIIVGPDEIRDLNKVYRNIDKITDVISFALEDDSTFVETEFRVLGDIYICLDKAIEQANEYNHSLKRELSFLTIHGILHLLGYDHMNKNDEKVMFELQEEILNEFKIQR